MVQFLAQVHIAFVNPDFQDFTNYSLFKYCVMKNMAKHFHSQTWIYSFSLLQIHLFWLIYDDVEKPFFKVQMA